MCSQRFKLTLAQSLSSFVAILYSQVEEYVVGYGQTKCASMKTPFPLQLPK